MAYVSCNGAVSDGFFPRLTNPEGIAEHTNNKDVFIGR